MNKGMGEIHSRLLWDSLKFPCSVTESCSLYTMGEGLAGLVGDPISDAFATSSLLCFPSALGGGGGGAHH